MTEDTEDTDHALSQRAASAGREKLAEVTLIYSDIKHELQGDRFWRYHRCISPSIQEFIEALSFMHYLEYGTLVTFGDVQRTLSDGHGVPVSMHIVPIRLPGMTIRNPAVFHSAPGRLSSGSIGPDWGAHAFRYIRHFQTRRAFKSKRCLCLRQALQSRQATPSLHQLLLLM